jgi:hypothetical protein
MKPTALELKQLNPILEQFKDEEINSFIFFMNSVGFVWLEQGKIFYHDRFKYSIRTMGLDLFVKNHDFISDELKELEANYCKNPVDYDNTIKGIGFYKGITRFSLFCGLIGLLFGWIIFSLKLWIFYEFLCLVSFIMSTRNQARLERKINDRLFKEFSKNK